MLFKRDEQIKSFSTTGHTSNTSLFLSITTHKKMKNRRKSESDEDGNSRIYLKAGVSCLMVMQSISSLQASRQYEFFK